MSEISPNDRCVVVIGADFFLTYVLRRRLAVQSTVKTVKFTQPHVERIREICVQKNNA